ncbi:hypothetical protein KJ840_02060 [Patescibacteria group bacterium]|nr:hypothetical protein [Patescibacteria group bacterium]
MAVNKERKVFILTVIVLVFLITFIHLAGYFYSNEEFYYIGNQPTRVGDMTGHFSFITQAAQGKVLFKNLYNPIEQRDLFFHPLWLIMGWLVKIFSLNIFLVYQLFKVIFAIIFCILLRKFLKEFFNLEQNIWLFPFCIFAAGIFTWLIEKDTFYNLYFSPLFALVLVLFILIYHAVLKYFKTHKNIHLFTIFLGALLLFLVHFYDAVSLLVVILSWSIYRYLSTKKFKNFLPALITILSVTLGAVYYYYIFSAEEALSRWAMQNFTPLPSWQFLIYGYGLLSPLAIIGAIKKRKEEIYWYLILWCLSSLFIIFSQIQFNRRFVLGLSIPLTILAYHGFKFILIKLKRQFSRIITAIIIILFLTQSYFSIFSYELLIIKFHGPPHYIARKYIEIFYWMKDNLPTESRIFADFGTWNTVISGYTGHISYLAGGYFTSFKENFDKIEWFFKDNQFDQEKKIFLQQNNIDYLFYSDIEKRLGDYNPGLQDYLKLIYQNKDAEIYQVLK